MVRQNWKRKAKPVYAEDNCVRFSKVKCHVLPLDQNNSVQCSMLGEERLEICSAERDWGVLVGSSWTWTNNVPTWPARPMASWLVSRIVWPAGLRKLLSFCTWHWWRLHFEYWVWFWATHFNQHLEGPKHVQRRATKPAKCLGNMSCEKQMN